MGSRDLTKTFSARLNSMLDGVLSVRSRGEGISRSELVRRALVNYVGIASKSKTNHGEDLFGRYGSSGRDPSLRHHASYVEYVNAKHNNRYSAQSIVKLKKGAWT